MHVDHGKIREKVLYNHLKKEHTSKVFNMILGIDVNKQRQKNRLSKIATINKVYTDLIGGILHSMLPIGRNNNLKLKNKISSTKSFLSVGSSSHTVTPVNMQGPVGVNSFSELLKPKGQVSSAQKVIEMISEEDSKDGDQ